jgi:dual specificity phosphatase 12
MASDDPVQGLEPTPSTAQPPGDRRELFQKSMTKQLTLQEIFYIPSMSEIEPGLFLGNARGSYNTDMLRQNGINAMLSLMDGGSQCFWIHKTREFVPEERHKGVVCIDSLAQDMLVDLDDICKFMAVMMMPIRRTSSDSNTRPENRTPGVLLVHCMAGISRSATAVIAFLMMKYKMSRDSALAEVKSKRRVNPNDNFMRQLEIWEQVGYNIWEGSKPKPEYQRFLDDRATFLRENWFVNKPIRIQSLS